MAGIKRRIGILKDDLHLGPERLHLSRRIVGDLFPFKEDLPAGWFIELEQGPSSGGFTASRFADQAKRLTRLQRKGDAVDCLVISFGARKNAIACDGKEFP